MNIDSIIIDNVLRQQFDRVIITRGKGLVRREAVKSMKVNKTQSTIRFKVEGTRIYQVDLKFNKSNHSIVSLSCTCPYEYNCKHMVAALFYIRKDIEKEAKTVKPVKSNRKVISADKWRAFEVKSAQDLYYQVEKLAPRGARNDYSMSSLTQEVTLQKDNNLKVLGYEDRIWSLENSLKSEIWLRRSMPNKIAVRCLTCTSKSIMLCKHTYFGLQELLNLDDFKHYISGEIDYHTIRNLFAEMEGIKNEQAGEIFEFLLTKKGASARSKNDAYISSVALMSLTNQFIKTIRNQFVNPSMLEFGKLVDSDPKINALLWNKGEETRYFPEIIEGKCTVKGNRLKSAPILDKGAKHTKEPIRQAILDLSRPKYLDIDSPDYLKDFAEVQKHFRDQIEVLQQVVQYYHKDPEYEAQNDYYTIRKSDIQQIFFVSKPLELVFELTLRKGIIYFEFDVYVNDEMCDLEKGYDFLPLFLVYHRDQAAFYKNHFDPYIVNTFLDLQQLQFSNSNLDKIKPLLQFLSEHYELILPKELLYIFKELRNGAKQLYLKQVANEILITPVLLYNNNCKLNALTGLPAELDGPTGVIDKEEKNQFLKWLSSQHPKLSNIPSYSSFLQLSIDDFIDNYWFADFIERCQNDEVEVLGYEDLLLSKYNKNRPSISTSMKSGIDWFDLEVDIVYGDAKVPMKAWISMIKNKEKYIKLSDGTLGIVPQEWVDRLTKIVDIADNKKDELKISKYHFNILDELVDDVDHLDWYQAIKDKKAKLVNYNFSKSYTQPKLLTATLREYQEQGYQWLRFLHEFGFGGCLADDMGLGKTVQVISLLAFLKETENNLSLVVVPNSLLFNWAAELKKFCPSISYLIYHGQQREASEIDPQKYDIIITTYGTATSDAKKLSEFTFSYLVLDESQAIKNPKSKRNKAMRILQAKNKLAMTGTPIENNTQDLFGQFNFINPGMLGNETEFARNFSKPIDQQNDKEQAKLLKKLIHPFILRRTKEQVASDLPPKSEVILYCDMEKDQRKHYDSLLQTIRKDVNNVIEEKGVAKSKLKILEALLRLRQVCNATQLVDPSNDSSSAKIKMLLEHIESNEQHKCLIFSQFVGMLSLIRAELDKQGIPYAYLDGKTRDREGVVKKFQEEEDCKVFLISLKAGNTGLNLTEADYVYIVDPWWNPAVEAQAIDRTHRIGQDKHIFAYRMICKDTIEEKIIKLQEKKRSLSNDLIQTDENVFKSLDKNELMSIFD